MRPFRSLALVLATGLALAACSGHGGNRLIDGNSAENAPTAPPANPHTDNPADPGVPGDPGTPAPVVPVDPSTAPTPSPAPELPSSETYQFDGFVIADGTYPANVAVGDKVSGTFKIDFTQEEVATNGQASIYRAFASIQGTAGSAMFLGGPDYLYVQDNAQTPFFVDTAHVALDAQTVNFDFYFFLPDGATPFPDRSLANVHDIDKKTFRRIVLWFETDPRDGGGFNVDVYAIQRADAPAMASR